jgi:hypothetical protein
MLPAKLLCPPESEGQAAYRDESSDRCAPPELSGGGI